MARFFKVKNFEKFQHYKDRSPPWIKLYNETLENYEFGSLNDATKGQLIGIWLLASRMDNKLPFDPRWIASKINATEPVDLEALYSSGFILEYDESETAEQVATPAQQRAKANGFGSRHISDEVKRIVWQRDGGNCQECGASDDIEYDHKHPVSKGGSSEVSNIQLLCRPCNRRKRVRVATPAQPLRSLEREGQDQDIEKRKEDIPPVAKATRLASSKFDEFWREYPKREGENPRKPAEKKFNALVKTGVDPDSIIAGARQSSADARARGAYGTKFIPQAIKWLNDQRFIDYAAAAFVEERSLTGFYARAESEQLEAWDRHNLSSKGKRLPRDRNGGWRVDAEWPPGYEPGSISKVDVPAVPSLARMQ